MDQYTEKKIAEVKDTFWTFFVERKPVAWLFITAAVILGTFSLMTLPREIQPEINIPYAAVSTIMPGASPTDVESLITEPLEQDISTVSDIKTLNSSSGFGSSLISIEFETGVDLDKKVQELKDAVDRTKPDLPDDALDPFVIKAEANEFSIITFSLLGNREIHELTGIAEDVQPELEKISGVSDVQILGGQKEQIEITLDPEKTANYGLDISTVSNLLKFANTNLPIGVISSDKVNYSIRIDNRYQSVEEIADTPLLNINNSSILLKDIAKVELVYPKQSVISRLSKSGEKSLPTVSLQVFKKEGGNILDIADNAKIKMDELKADGLIPEDVEIAVSNDNSLFIRTDLGVLTTNGFQTIILVVVILFLAMGMREGLIAAFSIPLTFLITFAAMDIMGLTINSLSLFSLVISLGIMVDTSIVIMEGIHDNIHKGMNAKDASLFTIATFRWPLIAGTATTICAFLPMLLVSGIVGEFMKTLPMVITATLATALFIGLTITPAVTSRFLKAEKQREKQSILSPIFHRVGKNFHNFIFKNVAKRSRRIFSILIILILFILSLSLPITGTLKSELFPTTDQNYFIVRIETPKGSVIEETEKAVTRIENILYKIPEVQNFLAVSGSSQAAAITEDITVQGATEQSNIGNVTVNLTLAEDRDRKSYEIGAELEKELAEIKDFKATLQQVSEGPPSEAPVTIRITGESMETLGEISNTVKGMVEEISGTKNIEDSFGGGLNEFKFVLNREKLNYHGLSAIQVASTIRNIVQGVESTNIKLSEEDIDLIVKYDIPTDNLSLQDIQGIEIVSPKGYLISLDQLGTYDFGESPDSISHEELKRTVRVTADIEEGFNSVDITNQLKAQTDTLDLPSNYEIAYGGELADIAESFTDLYKTMLVGILLIAFCLILEFNSYKQPFIILMTLPMALIGVFPGLLLIGLNLSFPAFLGVVALAGVVVNNAIILIDRINENRRNKVPFVEAIAEASNSRLEPIFMTTLTTVVGITPLALSNEFWAGLGFSLIFGLSFSTILTLLIIPVLYYTFEARKARKTGEL